MAFIDNYTAWVARDIAGTILIEIREITNHVLAWELRSSATFKSDKTTLVYYIRNHSLRSTNLINIKGINVVSRFGLDAIS